MTTCYHGSSETLTLAGLRSAPLYVTDDYDAACEYGDTVHEVTLESGLRIASERTVREVAAELHGRHGYNRAWDMLECLRGVRAELIAQGYDGATYTDETPDGSSEFEAIALWDAAESVASIVAE